MDETYRGHGIRLVAAMRWDAMLVELKTGATLPTKATAALEEGRAHALSRARELIDAYLDGEALRWRRSS